MSRYVCIVPGCTAHREGFSTLCRSHKRIKQRHGDPLQRPIKVRDLAPYLEMVDARVERNASSEAWSILDQRWSASVERAEQYIASVDRGAMFHRPTYAAAQQLSRLNLEVPSAQIARMALAMYLLQEFEPRRVHSDRGFNFQLARRVRALAPSYVGQHWDNTTQRMKQVYIDMPPRSMETLARVFIEIFGATGVALARLERSDHESHVPQSKRLAQALEALQ